MPMQGALSNMSTNTPSIIGTSTPAKKATNALNALKHGVFSQVWVDPLEQQQFDELYKAFQGEYATDSPTILIQIERLAMTVVKIRRLQKIENALYQRAQLSASNNAKEKVKLGLGESNPGKGAAMTDHAVQIAADSALPDLTRLDTLARYQVSLDRQLSKIIGEIQILNAAPKPKLLQSIDQ